MSRSIKFAKAGGPEVLEFIETQVSAPGPHEVRIKVKAIGVNRGEVMWRDDKFIKNDRYARHRSGLRRETLKRSGLDARDITAEPVATSLSELI